MTPFEEILGAHLSSGLVHSTPSVFLLAREVTWDPVAREILSPSDFSLSPFNAWFVELAASANHSAPIAEFLRVASRPHEFVVWYRASRNRPHNLHAYRWDHLARRVGLSR